ncbi:hypothetical protein [Aliivibrio salmonicida]|uniref:hypothetical protein n=1 Tax=Aliivibrio salmonicida TaxID=40269 RepID=UPI003D110597
MPRLISNASFDEKLSDLDRNYTDAEYFLSEGVVDYPLPNEDVVLPGNYRLVKSAKAHTYNGGELIKIRLIANDNEIVYAVNLCILDDIVNEKHCTQIMVWRSSKRQHRSVITGFAAVMFEHFSESFVIVASDTEQTHAGRQFWKDRISDAIDDEKYVYFLDHAELSDDFVPQLNEITSFANFISVWFDHGWGPGEEYKDRIFLISLNPLH